MSSTPSSAAGRSRLEKLALIGCGAAFTVFVANILYGRFAPTLGWDRSLRLDGVPEFLLLAAAALLFSIAALAAESRTPLTTD